VKVVIFAGRDGIRLGEQTITKPKPMVEAIDLISDEPFCPTYGQGVGDVDINSRVEFSWGWRYQHRRGNAISLGRMSR
jgi:hypothetical protein